jgi:hypothetical protein
VQARPDDPRSRTALALAQFSKGHADLGFAKLEEIAASDASTVADMALINARLRKNDYQGRAQSHRLICSANSPTSRLPIKLRGQVEFARKDFTKARQSFEQGAQNRPTLLSGNCKPCGARPSRQEAGRCKKALRRSACR